jgi:DNA-binding FrmR family transcriptional regulator
MKNLVLHKSHPDIIKRLRRANGHLETIIGMMEAHRGCLELAQQLHAVEKAVNAAKKALIHDHIDNCLETAVGPTTREQRAPVDEFKAITKYL